MEIVNTFTENDTLEERIAKFNAQVDLNYELHEWKGSPKQYSLMSDGVHRTGPMDEEAMMHWTATFAGGYRMRASQEMVG